MAKNNFGLPEWITIAGKHYKLVVFKIHNEYEDGKPEDCTMIPDKQLVEITGGEQFMTAYIPKEMYNIQKKDKK